MAASNPAGAPSNLTGRHDWEPWTTAQVELVFIDMHSHSISSDDARATVEQYLKWIGALRGKGYRIDGIALTEHRKFDADADYAELAEHYGVLILKGSELDTNMGHCLIYGVNEALHSRIDFGNVRIDLPTLLEAASDCGAVAVPAHPGRVMVGLFDHVERSGGASPDVWVVERVNGGSRPAENERAAAVADEHGYLGIGGSDAHFASSIGACLTEFPDGIANESDLVEALNRRSFRPALLEETRNPSR